MPRYEHDVKTCRSIYGSVNSDYLWHQILPREDIPLAIPLHRDLRTYSAAEIQSHVLRALRLRSNWSQTSPVIKKWASPKLDDLGGSYDILKLVNNGSVLIAIKRSRHQNASMTLSAFLLDDIQSRRLLVHYSSSVLLKQFEATIDEDGKALVLTAAVSKGSAEVMQVYRSQFPETAYSSSTFETPYEYQLQQQGLFHKVSLHGSFAASVIMGHVPEGTTSVSAVLLVNWKAGDQITVFPSMAENVKEVDINIIPPYLIIIAASNTELRVILVPLSIIERGSYMETPSSSWKNRRSLPEFQTIRFPCMDFYDICISDNLSAGTFPAVSVIAFPSISREDIYQSKKAMLLRIDFEASPVHPTNSDEYPSPAGLSSVLKFFDVRMESFPEYVNLGTSGRRAIWLEQSFKSDYVQVVRMNCGGTHNEYPSLNILIPPEPQLPFKPSSCRALAFDEASGRVCFGSYKGELFILDYA